jgi:acetyl esterase/lipase
MEFGLDVPVVRTEPLRYGRDYWRRIDVSRAIGHGPAPLVVWVDGADYDSHQPVYSLAWFPSFFYENGFVLARLQSRKPSSREVDGRAAVAAAGIAELVRQAEKYRIDPTRIILLGQGSGGHLAALLSTDNQFLTRAGVPFGSLRATVIVNGEGFDVPRRIATSSRHVARRYEDAFGTSKQVQARLSPIFEVGPPNAPRFLFIAVSQAADIARQAEEMSKALTAAGTDATLRLVPPQIGRTARSYLGSPQNEFTDDLLTFLRESTADRPGSVR